MSYVFGLDLVVLLALVGTLLCFSVRRVLRVPTHRAGLEAILAGYLVALAAIVLAPFGPVHPTEGEQLAASVNVVPFATMVGLARQLPGQMVRQLVGNALLFAPLGFLLPALFLRFRNPLRLAATAVLVSLGIEAVQLVMRLMALSPRSFDVDDVVLNVAGALLGFGLWWVVHRLLDPERATLDGDPERA